MGGRTPRRAVYSRASPLYVPRGASSLVKPTDGNYVATVRRLTLALIALTLALASNASGADAAPAATDVDNVAAYRARINASCRTLTILALADIQKMTMAAKSRSSSALGAAYGTLLGHNHTFNKVVLSVPVPPAARAQMLPIRKILAREVTLVEAGMRSRNFRPAIAAVETDGPFLDRLYDRAGLPDCGSRQTRILKDASKEFEYAMRTFPTK